MGKLWLPMNTFTVRENNREVTVMIPGTGDKSYDEYLEEAEREKTAEQLKKKSPRPVSTMDRKQVAGALKEFMEYVNRKRSGDINRKYF